MPAQRIRERLEELGWLGRGEKPLFDRLAFPQTHSFNNLEEMGMSYDVEIRDRIIADQLEGAARPVTLPRWLLSQGGDDVVVTEIDRFGLPLRTVLSRRTGLMRSEPYYNPEYVATFYKEHYRRLYRPLHFELGDFLAGQISLGGAIWTAVRDQLPQGARVLDFGCGMGGVAATFKLHGYKVWGCDLGRDFLDYGRLLGLDLIEGGCSEALPYAPFDLIILSQVIEHQADPVPFLTDLRRLLSEHGLLYIMVPGIFNIPYYYKTNILNYFQNAHVWHFTASTMSALLARSGFGVVSCDEFIRCVAVRTDVPATVEFEEDAGTNVLRELTRFEARATNAKTRSAGHEFLEPDQVSGNQRVQPSQARHQGVAGPPCG